MNDMNPVGQKVPVAEDGTKTRDPKKTVRIFLICLLAITLISVIGMVMLHLFDGDGAYEIDPPPRYEDGFEIPVWDADLTLDPEYMQLDRDVYYKEWLGAGAYRLVPLDEATYESAGAGPALIYKMLQAIIAGSSEQYNACFSSDFLEISPEWLYGQKQAFAPQRLYDIEFELMDFGEGGDGAMRYAYRVSYRILKNDGTFRDDIRGEEMRPIWIRVKNDASSWEIDWLWCD